MAKRTYLLDTSVLLTDSKSIFSFGRNDIIIPLKVLEEIDNHKKRQDGVGVNARHAIRILDNLRAKGSLQKGVRIARGKGLLFVKGYDSEHCPKDLDINTPDNQIVVTGLTEKQNNATELAAKIGDEKKIIFDKMQSIESLKKSLI